jgi:ADP-ribose pyrophosphatase
VPLAEAVHQVLSGNLTNASAVAGLLAAVHGRATGWRDLRPADAKWPARPGR